MFGTPRASVYVHFQSAMEGMRREDIVIRVGGLTRVGPELFSSCRTGISGHLLYLKSIGSIDKFSVILQLSEETFTFFITQMSSFFNNIPRIDTKVNWEVQRTKQVLSLLMISTPIHTMEAFFYCHLFLEL